MANLHVKALTQSTGEIVRRFVSHGTQSVSIQLFESELLSEQKYNEVCKEKDSESKAEIMATGVREKVKAEEKNFQKLVNVLEKKLGLKSLANFLQEKLGELCVIAEVVISNINMLYTEKSANFSITEYVLGMCCIIIV